MKPWFSDFLVLLLIALFGATGSSCSNDGSEYFQDGDRDGEAVDSDLVEVAGDGDLDPESPESEEGSFDPTALDYSYCPIDENEMDTIYNRLSLRQRIGQHLIIGIARTGESVSKQDEQRIRTYFLGGSFVSQITGIAVGAPQTSARFLHHAQTTAVEATGIPLFIASDQEGGVYTSINHMTGGTDSIGPAAIGATKNEWIAFEQFDLMGREIKAIGINMNFGPLLDTHYQRDNGNLNTRTFGPDVDVNTRLGLAAFSAFQRNLVIPTVKHFPGDGMLAINTHHEYSINTATKKELEEKLLKPFRAAFTAGADAVMMIPAQYLALDDQRAAIISQKIMRGFLRGEIGFEGLIVSDDLNMFGARLGLTEDQEQGYEALKAGADILLYVSIEDNYLEDLFTRIETGLQTGDINEAEFAASTKRILRYKQKYCLFEKPTYPEEDDIVQIASRIGQEQYAAMSLDHAEQAVVLLRNDGILPLSGKRVLCIGPDKLLPDPASGWSWLLEESFCDILKRFDPSTQTNDFIIGLSENSAKDWVEKHNADADVLVVATFQSYFSPEQQALMDWLLDSSGLPVVHVAQGVAFDAIQSQEQAAAVLVLQGSLPVMFEAASHVLMGAANARGEMLHDLTP
jgi:beta-N-acetylhexosaminidase